MRPRTVMTLVFFCLVLAASPAQGEEPDKIVVQHILIAFKKSVRNKPQERTKQQAKALAHQLLDRAEAGEEFDALVKEFTNDAYPGIMIVTNAGAPRVAGGRTRSELVGKFGDLAFRLDVGELGVANYHATYAPYGWHVIKRLE